MLFRSDRKSTRLNSSHTIISYAVFCLKKKTPRRRPHTPPPTPPPQRRRAPPAPTHGSAVRTPGCGSSAVPPTSVLMLWLSFFLRSGPPRSADTSPYLFVNV